jgi:hypothetical protein
MNWEYNKNREDNIDIINNLVSQEGYKDLGWANSGSSFSNKNTPKREIDCSLYRRRCTDLVFIDDINKEILHVDMSD